MKPPYKLRIRNGYTLALACVMALLLLAQTGEAMWQDTFDDPSVWTVTYAGGDEGTCKTTTLPGEDGKCLRITADFRNATSNTATRAIDLPRPRWISFRLKTTGETPVERLKLRLRLESPNCPLEFAPRLKSTSGGWHEFEADIDTPLSLVNIWRFYGCRRLTKITLIIEDAGGGSAFDLFLSDLAFRYGEDRVENYQPRQVELRPSDPPSIAVCMNTAGEYYGVEEALTRRFPHARISTHAFRGPHLPLDDWPPALGGTSLVVMVDTDTVALSDRELADLADYVHGGGSLLVFAGPSSVSASLDGRPLALAILPAETGGSARGRSDSALSGVLGQDLPCAGPLHEVKPKPAAEVLLSDGEGRPAIISGSFGSGNVALIACYPDASKDQGKSLFWSPDYADLITSVICRISDLKPAHDVQGAAPAQSPLLIEFPYRKRVFSPRGKIELAVTGPPKADIRVALRDTTETVAWEAKGVLDANGELVMRDVLPDLADGTYTLSANSGDMESARAEVVVAPTLDLNGFYPIIARLPVKQVGHWLGPKTLKWMVEDAASHGANTIAIPVLDAIGADPQGFQAEMAAQIELHAQEKGLATMYDYSHMPTFSHRARPPIDVRSPDAAERAADLVAPKAAACDLVPRLFAAKTIDEPTANFANLNLDSDGGEAYRKKCGFEVPDAQGEAKLTGLDRLNHWLFVADYGREQFRVLHDLFREQKKPWKLLHTFMEPGFGKEPPTTRFEDVFAWGGTADCLDFDIYPYWYPGSQKRRFAKVHYGFAFQRAVAQFYEKPMGFYVELDDRNHPYQKNPLEATGELAYTAVGEGCHYLNTFIYGIFGAGNMARPERWEDGGEDLRAIAETTPFLLSTERAKAQVALYFPYRQWIISGSYYPTFGLELFRRTFGECYLIHDEIAIRQGVNQYRAVVLLQTDILPKLVEEMLVEFVESGGVLVLDHCPSLSPEGVSLRRLKDAIGEMPSPDPWKAEAVPLGKGFVVKVPERLDATYRAAVEKDDADVVRALESWASEVFTEREIAPSTSCSDGEFEASLLRGADASALVVVNHRPDPAETTVEVRGVGHDVSYICDLATGRSLNFDRSGDNLRIPVSLTQRQGIILGLYPRKPDMPDFNVRVEGGEFVLNLSEPTGSPLPVFIQTIDPGGRRSSRHSREILLKATAEIRSSLAVNDLPGEWRFRAVVPALGTEIERIVKR